MKPKKTMKTIPMKNIPPPGDMLEFTMEGRGATPASLARGADLPRGCVDSILANEHPITQNVADRLEQFFGASAGYWLDLQRLYDNQPGASPMSAVCEACETG